MAMLPALGHRHPRPMPNVTVAISTYNRAHLVLAALESVFAQTYTDYDVVVVDNGSSDGTRDLLRQFGDRIRYAYQDNTGRAGGRNRAIELAAGRFVAFLDSDDLWLPDKLERQMPVLEANPAVGLVHGHTDVMDGQGGPLPEQTAWQRSVFDAAHQRPVTYAGYVLDCRCMTSTIVVRRECFERVGAYDPAIGLEDLDFYLRLLREYDVVFVAGAPLARYRMHESQTANEELAYGRIEAVRKHLELIETGPPLPDKRLARRNLLLALGDAYHVLGEGRATRRYTLEAVRLDPSLLLDRRVARQLAVSALPGRSRRGRA